MKCTCGTKVGTTLCPVKECFDRKQIRYFGEVLVGKELLEALARGENPKTRIVSRKIVKQKVTKLDADKLKATAKREASKLAAAAELKAAKYMTAKQKASKRRSNEREMTLKLESNTLSTKIVKLHAKHKVCKDVEERKEIRKKLTEAIKKANDKLKEATEAKEKRKKLLKKITEAVEKAAAAAAAKK